MDAGSGGPGSGPRISCSSGACGRTSGGIIGGPDRFPCPARQGHRWPILADLSEVVAGGCAFSLVTSVCSSALEHTARKSGKSAGNLCARGDLNPYVRGHQNLNLARLPISPLALDGTTVQTLPGLIDIAKR